MPLMPAYIWWIKEKDYLLFFNFDKEKTIILNKIVKIDSKVMNEKQNLFKVFVKTRDKTWKT